MGKKLGSKFGAISTLALTGVAGLVLLLAPGSTAMAQSAGAGTVSGTITDTNGAVVPDAKITVHNVDTGIDRVATTNGSGLYTVPFLQVGNYEVTASKTGFAKMLRKDLHAAGRPDSDHRYCDCRSRPRGDRDGHRRSGDRRSFQDRCLASGQQRIRQQSPHRGPALGDLCAAHAQCDHRWRQRTGQLSWHFGPLQFHRCRRRQQQPGADVGDTRTSHRCPLRLQPGFDSGIPGQHSRLQRGNRARPRAASPTR